MTQGPKTALRALLVLALAATFTTTTTTAAWAQGDSPTEELPPKKTPADAPVAEEEAAEEGDPKTGLRIAASVGLRLRPLASGLFLDIGHRWQLSDSESLLLKDTYFETGLSIAANPANVWVGGYIEAVPLAILRIRAQANYQRHFGNLGFVFVPDNANAAGEAPNWDVEDIDFSQANDLGRVSNALLAQLEVTPRVRLGRFVTILDSRLVMHVSDIEGTYHTNRFDMLTQSGDLFMVLRPTVGYLPIQESGETYLMTALRYERMQNFGATGVTRDSIGAVVLWGVPNSWNWVLENSQFALLAMYVLDEGPTPTDREGTPIISIRYATRFGAN